MLKPDDIAVALQDRLGDLTDMQAQKLVYYCQGWHLAWTGRPLFNDDFLAYQYGPVEEGLLRRHRDHDLEPTGAELDADVRNVIEHVVRVYGQMTATALSKATHAEAPYIVARGGLPADAPSRAVITQESMGRYFRHLGLSPMAALRHAVGNAAAEGVDLDERTQDEIRRIVDHEVGVEDSVAVEVAYWSARAG